MRKENFFAYGSLDLGIVLFRSSRQKSACISLAQIVSHDHPSTSHCDERWALLFGFSHLGPPCCWYHKYFLRGRKSNQGTNQYQEGGRRDTGSVRKASVHYAEVLKSTPRDPHMPPWRTVSPPTSPSLKMKTDRFAINFQPRGWNTLVYWDKLDNITYKSFLVIAKEIKFINDFIVSCLGELIQGYPRCFSGIPYALFSEQDGVLWGLAVDSPPLTRATWYRTRTGWPRRKVAENQAG